MKKNYTLKVLLSFFMIFSTYTYSQVNLYTQDFEGPDFDTYQLLNSGGSSVGFAVNASDYIQRNTIAAISGQLGNPTTGFSGNVIALEDHDGAGFFGQHSITTNPIDISGASGMTLKIRIAAPRGGDNNRYENEDILQVQVSIDGGGFQTIISTGGTSVTNNFYHDTAMDGINADGNDVLINQVSQQITANITGSGNSMVVRVLFDSQGSQEEMIFDDIIVDAAMVLSNEEVILDRSLELYPNPSNGNVTIKNNGAALQKASIVDVNGRTVTNIPLSGVIQDETLSLNLKTGVYFMKLTSDKASTTKKLIIK